MIELRDFENGLVPALHVSRLTDVDIQKIQSWIDEEKLICPGSKNPHPTDDLLILKSAAKVARNALNTDLTFVDVTIPRGTTVVACPSSKNPDYVAGIDTAKRILKSTGDNPVIVLWSDCYRVIEQKWIG